MLSTCANSNLPLSENRETLPSIRVEVEAGMRQQPLSVLFVLSLFRYVCSYLYFRRIFVNCRPALTFHSQQQRWDAGPSTQEAEERLPTNTPHQQNAAIAAESDRARLESELRASANRRATTSAEAGARTRRVDG